MPWVAAAALVAGAAMSAVTAANQPNYGKMASKAEKEKQDRLTKGRAEVDKAFAGYTPEFYAKREKAYLDYALPQEGQQFRDAQKQLTYSLSNRGVRNSTIAQTDWSKLFRTHAGAQQSIANTAVDQANALKEKVESGRQGVLDTLYQSADPGQARSKAISVASSFQNPNAFAPLGNMFSNLTNQWVTNQLLQSYQKGAAYAGGNSTPTYSLAPIPTTYND